MRPLVVQPAAERLPGAAPVSDYSLFSWGEGERNYYFVLGAEAGWFPGPGAFVVAPGQERRLA